VLGNGAQKSSRQCPDKGVGFHGGAWSGAWAVSGRRWMQASVVLYMHIAF